MDVLVFAGRERALNFRHAGLGHHLTVGGSNVTLSLLDAQMPADCGDLGSTGSGFRQTPAGCFPKSMRPATVRQSGLIAPISETVELSFSYTLALTVDRT